MAYILDMVDLWSSLLPKNNEDCYSWCVPVKLLSFFGDDCWESLPSALVCFRHGLVLVSFYLKGDLLSLSVGSLTPFIGQLRFL